MDKIISYYLKKRIIIIIIDSRISDTLEIILKILIFVQLPFYILETLYGLSIFGYD